MDFKVIEELQSPDIKPFYLGSITRSGAGASRISYRVHPDESQARILDLIVEPSHRLQGVGRELVEQAELRFREHGVTRVVGYSAPDVHGFWRKLGYQILPDNNILKVIY